MTASRETAHLTFRQEDSQPAARYPISSMTSCSVQNLAYRKNSPILPTLILHFELDQVEQNRNKLRPSQINRRSFPKSRADTLLFRSASDQPDSILDWLDSLLPHLQSKPPSSHFDSKFSFSDRSGRPSTSTTRPHLPQSQGSYVSTSSSKAPSAALSPALSIRSSHTGLSSPHTNSPNKPLETFDASSAPAPDPLDPLPPFRFAPAARTPSPAPPRETILDRAFMMNCIPGASTASVDEKDGAMNSIARFEAIMQELEANKMADRRRSSHALSEDANPSIIPSSAQRALDFISQGSNSVRLRKKPPRSRPTSLALPFSSTRTSIIDDLSERRRSSVSIAPSTSTIAAKSKRLSIADFTKRLSSASSHFHVHAHTASPSIRSSWASDGSFGCSGDDDHISTKRAWRVSGGAFGI